MRAAVANAGRNCQQSGTANCDRRPFPNEIPRSALHRNGAQTPDATGALFLEPIEHLVESDWTHFVSRNAGRRHRKTSERRTHGFEPRQ
jgi:hypothetical protein